ncbi:hypothetical protein [Sphaerisporangium corydalis]|uniref:Lipoprotein n=1 Tax=Sphaerisporangium corydalis TaxID=1441875 RepID=A0ABV9E8H0_9ACTN|nr:hypothetical protein [Sphaerisporangium corydalis]
MSAPRWLPAALAMTFVLAACSSGGDPARPTAGGGSTDDPTEAVSPASTVPAGVTPEEYSAALKSAAGPVGSSLSGIAKSRSLKSLNQRLKRAESAVSDAVEKLGTVTPPADITAEHSDYVAALRDLDNDLGGLRDSVDGRKLCTASAVLARLGKADGFGAAKSAGGDLAAKGDYPANVVKVKTPKERTRRPANGTFLRSGNRGGNGRLTVDNGGKTDAVLTLVRGKSKLTSFYVRKGRKTTVRGIPDGTFKIFFTGGTDWDKGARAFTRNCSFERFEDTVKFRTIRSATLIQFSTWTITLQPVIGGNAKTSEVDPDSFPS